jgi:hypothetical protein
MAPKVKMKPNKEYKKKYQPSFQKSPTLILAGAEVPTLLPKTRNTKNKPKTN